MDTLSTLKNPTMGRGTEMDRLKTTATDTNNMNATTDQTGTQHARPDKRTIAMDITEAMARNRRKTSLVPECARKSSRRAGPTTQGIRCVLESRMRLRMAIANNRVHHRSSKPGQTIANHP